MPSAPSTISELLTQQFYDWEIRGRGRVVYAAPVELEPPFRPFEGHVINRLALDDGLIDTGLSRLGKGFKTLFGPIEEVRPPEPPVPEIEEPPPDYVEHLAERIELVVALPPKYEPNPNIFAQCLLGLAECRAPLTFEIIGTSEGIVTVISAVADDAEFVFGQLKAHFPEAVITAHRDTLERACHQHAGRVRVHEFGLTDEFMIPLRSRAELATDPLVSVCGALEHLQPGELGVLQVLFEPARSPWVRNMRAAVTTEDGRPFFDNAPELVAQTKRKTSAPLYAVVVRVATRGSDDARAETLLRQLAGALRLFGHHDANALLLLDNEDYPDDTHVRDLLHRLTHRSGMLLNSDELVALVHLPSSAVRSRKLQRETKHTKAAPAAVLGAGLMLGENTHEGRTVHPALGLEQRVRHVHLIGASGTGKSTLLLNLIGQDVYQGNGFAVIDPHGDLIDQIISFLPPERIADTLLIDPADSEFPVGLNLLSAHSDEEKNLLASDLVAVFRRLSTSWGDQMNSVLGNAILAFLESTRGGTLADLRRFLIEPEFRKEFLGTVQDPEVAYYWRQEFPLLKGGSLGPLLTRLDTFLRPKAIRYMVAQRENRIEFGAVMNEGRIVLVKLSQGLIGEENASLLGSLLVAKFHQLAIARQALSREQRRPFFLYLDEFQHFVSPSMQAILSGARKYGLGLVLAHQDLRQLARDPELMGAVMANAGTRICFRVGDGDAEKLASGFAEFRAEDLQRLETGEAICRVGRADHDFNLKTLLPPAVEAEVAESRRNYLREVNRRAYGRPRSEVEAELARSRTPFAEERVDPFVRRTARPEPMPEPDNAPPTAPLQHAPVSAGRATPPTSSPTPPPLPKSAAPLSGALVPKLGTAEHREHRRLQNSLAMLGQQRGWRSQLEAPLGEHGNADVLLTKNDFRVACEVALTSPPEYEVQSIGKRLAAGVSHVLVVSTDQGHLDRIATLAAKTHGKLVGERVRFGPPDLVAGVLDELDASLVAGEEVIGEMHVRYAARAVPREDQARRQEHLKTALKRLKGTKSRPRA